MPEYTPQELRVAELIWDAVTADMDEPISMTTVIAALREDAMLAQVDRKHTPSSLSGAGVNTFILARALVGSAELRNRLFLLATPEETPT